jgi:ABC-type lipoprotein export system ATPase subunit
MTLFSIKNLVCSYNRKHPVLYISDLEIPAGEICILFGKSGSGKSTLLETLGLMTNTIASSKEPYQTVFQQEGITMDDDCVMSLKFYGRHNKEKPEEITYVEKRLGDLPLIHENGFNVKSKDWFDNLKDSLGMKNNDFNDIWKGFKRQRHLQQRLRDEYFAFIFQNTNLMPNFSAEENAAIPEMIDLKTVPCGKDKSNCPYFEKYNIDCDLSTKMCAIVHARQTLVENLGIPKEKLSEPAREFSGGQQQRITFARANNSHFSVLFGDEPTGNLDFHNSKLLMRVIRDLIDASHNKILRSAVIVSHSIDLTLQFANRIVFIETKDYHDKEKNALQYYGKIDSSMIYVSGSSTEDDAEREWRHVGFLNEVLSNEQMDSLLTKFLRK